MKKVEGKKQIFNSSKSKKYENHRNYFLCGDPPPHLQLPHRTVYSCTSVLHSTTCRTHCFHLCSTFVSWFSLFLSDCEVIYKY